MGVAIAFHGCGTDILMDVAAQSGVRLSEVRISDVLLYIQCAYLACSLALTFDV